MSHRPQRWAWNALGKTPRTAASLYAVCLQNPPLCSQADSLVLLWQTTDTCPPVIKRFLCSACQSSATYLRTCLSLIHHGLSFERAKATSNANHSVTAFPSQGWRLASEWCFFYPLAWGMLNASPVQDMYKLWGRPTTIYNQNISRQEIQNGTKKNCRKQTPVMLPNVQTKWSVSCSLPSMMMNYSP